MEIGTQLPQEDQIEILREDPTVANSRMSWKVKARQKNE